MSENKLPCDGEGWGFPVSNCAPPVGKREGGYDCGTDCPLKRLVEGRFGEAHQEPVKHQSDDCHTYD